MTQYKFPHYLFTLIPLLVGILFAGTNDAKAQQTLQRNLFLLDRTKLLSNTPYSQVFPVSVSKWWDENQKKTQNGDIDSCQAKLNSHECIRNLMSEVDAGINLNELSPYLERLATYSAEQNILVSYAGEVWYRTDRTDDALTLWQSWLLPQAKIQKIIGLFQAGYHETSASLISSLDSDTKIQ